MYKNSSTDTQVNICMFAFVSEEATMFCYKTSLIKIHWLDVCGNFELQKIVFLHLIQQWHLCKLEVLVLLYIPWLFTWITA